jgi:hypothetical protein
MSNRPSAGLLAALASLAVAPLGCPAPTVAPVRAAASLPANSRATGECEPVVRSSLPVGSPALTFELRRTGYLDRSVNAIDLGVRKAGAGSGWQERWTRSSRGGAMEAITEVEAKGWFAGGGQYAARAHVHGVRVETEFQATPDDVRVHVILTLRGDEVPRQGLTGAAGMSKPLVMALSTFRVRPPTGDISLRRCWQPTSAGSPHYRLRNGGPVAIYGSGIAGNFTGHVERWERGWRPYNRGGVCATVAPGKPLLPGYTNGAGEEHHMVPRPFLAGRYRYVLFYSLVAAPSYGPQARPGPDTTETYHVTVHQLTDEFTVAD